MVQYGDELCIMRRGPRGLSEKMNIIRSYSAILALMLFMTMLMACPVRAEEAPDDAVKVTEPVKTPEPEKLILPYAFYNESFGAAVGYVYGITGYPQPYSTILGTVIAGSNSALAAYLLTREIRIPYTERFFFDTDVALSTYGTIQSYVNGNPDYADEQAGSNDSDKNNFVEGNGKDYILRANFKYLLPMGAGRDLPQKPTVIQGGLPVEGAGDGLSWDPLVSGRTYLEMRPYWRSQTIDSDYGTYDQKTYAASFSIYRENTDFMRNPSAGSSLRIRYTQDWGWFDSSRPYYVTDVEYSRYFSLGSSEIFRQKVLALDFWTADSYSWDRTTTVDGKEVNMRPPAYQGATLGGLWRMRGYPTSRFNDQAAVYYAVEYRLIPQWNPFASIDLLEKYLGIKWWQIVPFVEAGRVAPVWTVHELHSAMKWDAGIGFRAMAKGIVGRLDIAASREGFGVNMMVGQPYQF